jgi:hypothetical protein
MRARKTKLPCLPSHVVTHVTTSAPWPLRVTERRLAMTELSVPESCASTPAPSGSSTNLPAEDALLRPFRHSPVRRGLHRLVDEVQDVAVGILEPHGLEVSCHVHVALTRRVRQVVVVLERDTF